VANNNFKQLLAIEKNFAEKGIQILAFPCNQFNNREPRSNEEVLSYIRGLGAVFPVFCKVDVNGDKACELFKYLRSKSNLEGGKVDWNFGKFIVNRDGSKVEYYPPNHSALDICEDYIKFL
jgi:glutathione peroxidase-family protein